MSHIDIKDVVAHIKEEFLLPVEPKETKETKTENGEVASEDSKDKTSEPPRKKQKLTGTNKNRPKLVKAPRGSKLCRSLWCLGEGEEAPPGCSFPKCQFMHDVSAFLSAKPADLGQECHNYRTYGRCHYGLVCRFGGDHIEGERNKVQKVEGTEKQQVDGPAVINSLKKELQHLLRKRQYDFSKAKEANRKAQSEVAKNSNKANITAAEATKAPDDTGVDKGMKITTASADTTTSPVGDDAAVAGDSTGPVTTSDKEATSTTTTSSGDTTATTSDKEATSTTTTNSGDVAATTTMTTAAAETTTTNNVIPTTTISSTAVTTTSTSENTTTSVNATTTTTKVNHLENAAENGEVAMLEEEEEKKEPGGGQEREGKRLGPAPEEDLVKPTEGERRKKKIEWRGKTYLAPLTTLGNLPFRRVCKQFEVDITCGEMALATNLLQGFPSEWALVKKHASEDCFGIQLCGSNAETMTKCTQLLEENTEFDFMDINMGCPIDLIYKQGGGSALMRRHGCLEQMVRSMKQVLTCPLTLKMRTAVYHDTRVAHSIIQKAKLWDVSMVTVHGRSREQRYLKLADWDYVGECAAVASPLPLFGNGDVLSYEDYNQCLARSGVAGVMIARGALIKPWIFKEIKEQRHWDISSSERLDMLRQYTNYGMEHWGSDDEGVEKTRRFLLEWLSFLHRYIPVGLLEHTQRINQQPPAYKGRDHLETLLASRSVNDWIKISEMLLGPVPADFAFLPKHKANAY